MAIAGHIVGSRLAAFVMGVASLGLLVTALLVGSPLSRADAADRAQASFQGVASCAGSTCHGRMEADGAVVRQDELMRWQEPSTPGGAHSRAFSVLSSVRGRQIAATLGLGDPATSQTCTGCHATPASGTHGMRFQQSDGVGCEACHGPSSGWIASHYAVGASHAANVARGMTPLDQPMARANVCLDCHFGSGKPGQFASHRLYSAGHPRISFELDLFSTMQQHHDEDADYIRRKGRSDGVRTWAVGQAMAVNRALTLYASPRGSEGAFPEFAFFDCHSCHRKIYDQEDRVKSWENNPGRPIPAGMPPFNDENMILLTAAARVAAPGMAARFDSDSRAFHAALGKDRAAAIVAGGKLAATASGLASALSASAGGDTAFAMVDAIAGTAITPRFTDYEGSVQAVMAIDTLLNALVKQGRITVGAAAGIRANINRAYAAVRDPNDYRGPAFRTALAEAVRSIRVLR
ncbi:multiheme c-type cytochrome [Sphingomonas sp. ERG5]|uniref:multiheme c-type cytochrome n=1 Tax=Sphingomonas sp. ERG5 TaxID=1381597 RepID=UPI0009DED216|nr:multiheme c-type cytochrome [Sphingomonas sp. ERG5]